MAEVVWTRQQQANTLAVIPMVEAVVSRDDPQRNVTAAVDEMKKLVPGLSEKTFASVAPDIITGLVNLAGMLTEHYAQTSGIPVSQILRNASEAVLTTKLSD